MRLEQIEPTSEELDRGYRIAVRLFLTLFFTGLPLFIVLAKLGALRLTF